MPARMIVVGLDCAAPSLVFDQYRDVMPNLAAMMESGIWGPLRSSAPPITVPAWTCMVSGRDPGELGLYGFRNRIPRDTRLRLANGNDVRVKRVWDWLGDHGFRVAPLFVPLTSPPQPVRGQMVSGFLWPGDETPWSFPSGLASELESRFGAYLADVEHFRASDTDRIYSEIVRMTRQHFDIARHIWSTKRPDFMMLVEIGVDRFHHALWHHIDPTHPKHDPDNPWRVHGRRYYGLLDEEIGNLRRMADPDTAIVVVSDHGARAMRGGFCINEWLIEHDYLALRGAPEPGSPLNHDDIDWPRTSAWAEGGYYARIFLNIAGREPSGTVHPSDAAAVRARLTDALGGLTGDQGEPIPVEVHNPTTRYRATRGFPPDLMVYFDGLALRAIGSIGHGRRVISENDTGPDTCNHDWDGIFVMDSPELERRGRIEGAQIYDITPTILGSFGVPRPPGISGRDWTSNRD